MEEKCKHCGAKKEHWWTIWGWGYYCPNYCSPDYIIKTASTTNDIFIT